MLEHQNDNRLQDAKPAEQYAMPEYKGEPLAAEAEKAELSKYAAAAEAISLAQAEEEAIALAQKLAAYAAELQADEQLQYPGQTVSQEQTVLPEHKPQPPSRIYRLVCLICGALSLLGFVVFLINCLAADKIVDSVAKLQGYLITIALLGLGISLVEIGLKK